MADDCAALLAGLAALLPFGGHVQAHWEMAGNRVPGFLVKCIEAIEKRGRGSERHGVRVRTNHAIFCGSSPIRPAGALVVAGLNSVGIYRISGNVTDVQRLRQLINQGWFIVEDRPFLAVHRPPPPAEPPNYGIRCSLALFSDVCARSCPPILLLLPRRAGGSAEPAVVERHQRRRRRGQAVLP